MEIPPSSQGWADRITWLVYGVVGTGGLAAFLNAIFNRKKQPSEIAKLDAETEATEADTSVKLSAQLVVLHDKLNGLEATMDRERQEAMELRREAIEVRREAADSRLYYREQITYFESLDNAYRNRFHDIAGLVQALSIALATLQMQYKQETQKDPPEVRIATFDDIVQKHPLPSPPPRTESP